MVGGGGGYNTGRKKMEINGVFGRGSQMRQLRWGRLRRVACACEAGERLVNAAQKMEQKTNNLQEAAAAAA